MARQAALFDLDGVLVDSEGVYYEFWDNIDRMFPTGIPDFAASIKGSTLKKIMDYFPDPDVRSRITTMLEEQERSMRYVLFDGVIPFLDELRSRHIPCAIVTSSNEDKMHKLFDRNLIRRATCLRPTGLLAIRPTVMYSRTLFRVSRLPGALVRKSLPCRLPMLPTRLSTRPIK